MRRESFNEHDFNAIAVYMWIIPEGKAKFVQIGYLKAPLAKKLAPKMDAGTTVTARVASFWAPDDDEFEHPRVSLVLEY